MEPNSSFLELGKDFWAHVRSISQHVGYTERGSGGRILVPTIPAMASALDELGLSSGHIIVEGAPTEYGNQLHAYFVYRAKVLNEFVEPRLMDEAKASALYARLVKELRPRLPSPMNKQKGEKRKVAYLTAMINMLIDAHAGMDFDYDPRKLTTVTRDGMPLRTLARRVDGAFPTPVNPVAVWEIKEYYFTTTFGSRVADGVYETLLDGMELEELREHEGQHILHYLMIDAHFTWWDCGRSYLCRIIDMLHMGYVDEVLFGSEVVERLPILAKQWATIVKERQRDAKPIS